MWMNMNAVPTRRSEEHTSELQSRFGISYAVFCLKKKQLSPSSRIIFPLLSHNASCEGVVTFEYVEIKDDPSGERRTACVFCNNAAPSKISPFSLPDAIPV